MMNELYMDYYFWNQSIGAELIEFAKEKFNIISVFISYLLI